MAGEAYTKLTKEVMEGAIGSMKGALVQLHLADNYDIAKKQENLIREAEEWCETWLSNVS